ncbi:SETMR methyltransferase, partial [Acromyrmex insinuator]
MSEISEEIRYVMLFYYKKGKNLRKEIRCLGATLTQRNLIDRISISKTLLKRNEIDPFLKQIITDDEKWMKYKNIIRKRSWNKRGEPPQTTSKPGLMANTTHIFDDTPKVLMHPPYSPDLAPSDYHLFRSLQNSSDGKTLADKIAAENHLKKFFADNPQKFYMDGIMKLLEKWQKVIDNNGQYILDFQ